MSRHMVQDDRKSNLGKASAPCTLGEIAGWGGLMAWVGLALGLLIGSVRAWAAVKEGGTGAMLAVLCHSVNQSFVVAVVGLGFYLLAFVPLWLLIRRIGWWAHAAGVMLLTIGLLGLVKPELDPIVRWSPGSVWNLFNGLGMMACGVMIFGWGSLWLGVGGGVILRKGRWAGGGLVGAAALLNLVGYGQQARFAQAEIETADGSPSIQEDLVSEPNTKPYAYRFADRLAEALLVEGATPTSEADRTVDFGAGGTQWEAVEGGPGTLRAEDGVLKLISGSAESGMESPRGFGVRAEDVVGIELRLKVDRGRTFKLMWKRATDREFRRRDSNIVVPLSQIGQFEVYRIKMKDFRNWNGEIDGLRIFPSDSNGATAEIDYLRFLTESSYFATQSVGVDTYPLDSKMRQVIFVHPPSTLTYKVTIPPHATLQWGMGIADPRAPVEFTVTLQTGEKTISLYDGKVAERKWVDTSVDLAPWQGQEVALTFSTTAAGGLGFWSNPILYQREEHPRPNVVIYLVDCLRADHVGAYGYGRPTTPFFDRFAAEGALFLHAYAQQTWTRPSVTSLFSSQYPLVHKVNKIGKTLPEGFATLAEVFSAQGYATGHVSDNGNAGILSGLTQGFEQVFTKGLTSWLHRHHIDFSAITPWLRERRGAQRPFFLYVHTLELHGPYITAPPYNAYYDPEYQGAARVDTQSKDFDKDHINRQDADHLKALYDGLINLADDKFQTFVGLLQDGGVYDNTLLIVTADHGEAFGEHGQWMHGAGPYQELIRVPLLMRFPGRFPVGQVIRENMQLIDLAPTVLEAVGLPVPEDFQGRSLASLLTGRRKEWPHAVVYAEGTMRGMEVVARLEEGWKFVTPVLGERSNSEGGGVGACADYP